jgi:hypothetical protein
LPYKPNLGKLKRILQYSRHFIRAKGRHGTHSPFVYAFVEQVMRARAGTGLPQQDYMPRPVFRLLYKTIKHLAPGVVYTTAELYPALRLIETLLPDAIDVVLMPLAGLPQPAAAGALICTEGKETDCLQRLVLQADTIKVLWVRPHLSKERFELWNRLATLPEVNVSLDYWHLGLLVKDPAFKAKQHFRLR